MKRFILWRKIRQLNSPKPAVRAAAIAKLAGLEDERAVEPLSQLLHDQDRALRVAAAQALGAVGHPSAVGPLLATLLDEKYWDVRYEVVEALRNIGDPAAVNELVVIMDRDDQDVSLQQFAAWALKQFGWEHLTPAQQAVVRIRRDEWAEIPRLGLAAVTPLVAAVRKGTPRVRREAAETLVKISDPQALASLVGLLKEPDPEVRRNAAVVLEKNAWARLNDAQLAVVAVTLEKWPAVVSAGEAAIAPLAEVLQKGERNVRLRALEALGTIGGQRAARLLSTAMHDNDVAIRRAATCALGVDGDSGSLGVLVTALGDTDFDVRQAAAAAPANRGWKATNLIEQVRFAVARSDWSTAGELGAPAVELLVADLQHSSVRSKTLEALVHLGAPAVAPLIGVLRDPTAALRMGAAEALGEIGDQRAIEALDRTLADAEVTVRQAAASALARLGWQPDDDTHRAKVALALHDWPALTAIGPASVKPLLAAVEDGSVAEQVLHTIEQILQATATKLPVVQLDALAALGGSTARPPGPAGRPTAAGKPLQSAIARRRISQLARAELQRRAAPTPTGLKVSG